MTKEQIIQKIRDIIKKHGSISPSEVSGSSPIIKTIGNDHQQLAEKFNLDDVDAITYVHETEVDEDFIEYEDLSEDLLEEILNLVEDYKVAYDKAIDKSRDENF